MFPKISRLNFFLSLTRLHNRVCIRIYIFNFKKPQKARRRRAEETKEERRISVENQTWFNDIVCEFALCAFNFIQPWISSGCSCELNEITSFLYFSSIWSTRFQEWKWKKIIIKRPFCLSFSLLYLFILIILSRPNPGQREEN